MNNFKVMMNGIIKENPTFVLLLGMCPTLGTTSSAINGMGMGLATMFVLICSNVVISLIKNLIPDINLTPYSIWLATVVVSGISYLSYLLKRYVFHESGTLVSGIIGGLYSSTATISVLARKSRKASEQEATEYVAAMLLAVSMMFLRFMILILIFSREIFQSIYPYLLIMSVIAAAVGWFIHSRQKRPKDSDAEPEDDDSSNPLEFKVALILPYYL